MRLESVRAFRTRISQHTRKGEMVLITNHGKMVGCFLPIQKTVEIPIELKRETAAHLGRQIARALNLKKITEKAILDDFRQFKANRRRQ